MQDSFKSLFPQGFNVWEWKIRTAKDGYEESKNDLLSEIISQLSSATFENKTIQKFLIDAFNEIQGGESADHALLLKGKVSGKKKKSFLQAERTLEIALSVLALRKSSPQPTWEECFDEVAKLYNISSAQAKKAYNRNKDYAITQLESMGEYSSGSTS